MTAHALLSASSAERWLACPPSARATENMPDEGSAYTVEGSQAHAIAELKLRKYLIEPMSTRTFNSRLKKIREGKEYVFDGQPTYQEEMLRHTDVYLDYIKEMVMSFDEKPYTAVEKRVDFSHIVPEGFGTCDCILIGGDTMHVIDFKYGKGVPVSAEKNPQMLLYALGAAHTYGCIYNIQKVMLSIVQPRISNISEWACTAAELAEWGNTINETAQLAYQGKGEFKTGEHCRFCRLKGNCQARTEEAFAAIPMAEKPPAELSPAELAKALEKASFLSDWAKDVQEYALKSVLDGGEVPGWKAVHGRSIRRFTDQEQAFKALIKGGVDEAMLYERKPMTLAAIEKAVGKKEFADMAGDFIETPPGKPTLVPETDKRPSIAETERDRRHIIAELFGDVEQ